MNILTWIINIIKQIFGNRGHIQSPTVSGSPDYITPGIDNVDQNWQSYLSQPYRTQWAGSFDEDNCATRSAIEVLEAILNYYLKNNLFPDFIATFLKQYCNQEGYVKLSIRYNAKLNNTTTSGASVDTVWNNFSIYGFVPESVYPDPATPFTWADYYSPVPDDIVLFGKSSAKTIKVIWQVIWNNNWQAPNIDTIREALKGSPVYFASSVGTRDDNGIEQPPQARVYQHARVLFSEDDYQEVLDSYSYPNYIHKLSKSFPLACTIKAGIKFGHNPQ